MYRSLRERLAEELGIDPSADVTRLHRDLLGGGEPTQRRATPVPAQLPAVASRFTGREELLSSLDALVGGGESVVRLSSVSGTAGVGKTALAIYWAHRRRADFPDGQLFVNLRGYDRGEQVGPGEALARFLRALGVTELPATVDERAALYRTLVADRRILVVLDNARTAEQVHPLLPGGSRSLTLVTSRDRMTSLVATHDAGQVAVDALSTKEALDLLARMVGTERMPTDQQVAERLAVLCGRLPLALRIAGASLALDPHLSVESYVEHLESPDRLNRLALDGDRDTTVAGAFDLSYATLPEAARDLFARLGLIPGEDFHEHLAVAISAREEAETRRLLGTLVAANLLDQHEPNRYRFHDLIRLYARGKAKSELDGASVQAVIDATVEWFEDRFARYRHEFANRIAAVREFREHPQVWRMAAPLILDLAQGHDPCIAMDCYRIARTAAHAHHDLCGEAITLQGIGVTYWESGDRGTAVEYGEQAVELAERSGDEFILGRCLTNLGLFHYANHHHGKAIEALTAAVKLPVAEGEERRLPGRFLNLANAHRSAGNLDEAERHLSRTLDLVAEADPRGVAGNAHYSLGRIALIRGDFTATLEHAVELWAEFDRPVELARTRHALGDAYAGTGDRANAVAQWRAALETFTRLGMPEADEVTTALADDR